MKTIIRDTKHLVFIRTLPCLRCGSSPSQACHIRLKGGGGMGMKPGDDKTLPYCHVCHNFQHSVGEKAFYKDIYAAHDLSKSLYLLSGDSFSCINLMLKNRGELF